MTVRDDMIERTKKWEGSVGHLYLDPNGFVTVGVGHMIPNADACAAIPFVTGNGDAATEDQKRDEWNLIKGQTFGQKYGAGYYHQFCNLKMNVDPDVNNLLGDDIDVRVQQLQGIFPDYDGYPDAAKEGLMDMIYNLGEGGLQNKFPSFCKAVKSNDWQTAAVQCHRKPPVSDARNDDVRQLFLSI